MATRNSNDARTQWAELIELVRTEPVHIERRGREVAVLVSPAFFERAIEAIEDIEDVTAAHEAMAEDGPRISHEELMRELGLNPAADV